MFAVDDIDDVVGRLRSHGAELVGEIAQYEDIHRLCFLRGPEASSSDWPSNSAEPRWVRPGAAPDGTGHRCEGCRLPALGRPKPEYR